jgi:coenzyme PQQ precursor peptide PqqA
MALASLAQRASIEARRRGAGGRILMKAWHKPQIEETQTGLEVTSYMPAELDLD